MARRMHGLALSLEAHDNSEDNKQVEKVDHSNTAEAKELASKESGSKVDALQNDLDSAEESLESIHVLVASLESFNQSGGLDQNGARVMNMYAQELLGKAGIYGATVVPSFEAFGATSRKTEATKLSMESIGDMARDIWAKIIAGLKRLKEWVLKHFYHYFGEAESLLKRAREQAEAARKTTGTKETTIEAKDLLNAIRIEGKAPTVQDVTNFGEWFGSYYAKAFSTEVPTLENPAASAEAVNSALEASGKFTPVDGEAGIHIPDDSKAARTGRLPGDKALYLVVPKDKPANETAAMRALSHIELKLAPYDKKAQQEGAGESLATLSSSDVGRNALVIERVLGEIVANRKNLSKVGEMMDKAIAAAEKEANGSTKDEDGADVKELARAKQAAIGNVRNYTVRPLNEVTDYAVTISRRLLEYGDKSLRAHKKD